MGKNLGPLNRAMSLSLFEASYSTVNWHTQVDWCGRASKTKSCSESVLSGRP